MDDFMTLQKAMKASIAYRVVSQRPNFEERRDDWREAGKVNCKINKGMAFSPRGLEYHAYTVDEMKMASEVKTDNVCREPDEKPCLFNLRDDPCELREYVGEDRNRIIEELSEIAKRYHENAVKVGVATISPWADRNKGPDENADPARFSGVWTPWITLKKETVVNYGTTE